MIYLIELRGVRVAKILMVDDGISFDGNSLEQGPLGGAETAFISLANSFSERGHEVLIRNNCSGTMKKNNIDWAPLENGVPDHCDLYIANRSDKLLTLSCDSRAAVFWIHNPAQYLLKFRYLTKIWSRKPVIVFSGNFHANSYPKWAPDGGRKIVPYGISDEFVKVEPTGTIPEPRAIFTSNPLRSLSWLLGIWKDHINPQMPNAELHIYSGAATYGELGSSQKGQMQLILDKANAMSNQNVCLHDPIPKKRLADVLSRSRVLPYRGDPGETFCLAVGEAQAAGLPAVVQDIGCVAERVVNGKTGFVTGNDEEFANATLKLLRDDNLWSRNHEMSLKLQRNWGWNDAAAEFEGLIS